MPDQELIDAIGTGDLITQVDATRSDYDLSKLTVPLATLVSSRLTAARGANAAVLLAGGSAAAASARVVESRQRLGGLLRNGHAHLRSIPEEDAPAADVLQALETYGFERGNLGDLESPSRLESLARSAQQVTPELPANLRYPANILTRLTTWRGVLDANKLIAGGGLLQTIIDDKDEKRDGLLKAISRVRYHYCAASDDGEKTVELARIGMQPKRDPGEAQPQPLPGALGTATFQASTRQLTVPAMPDHATFLVAWRKPAGGEAEQAGVSTEPVVGVSDFSPLQAGVTYELWVMGRNSRGSGPESNHVTFTA